MAEAISIFASYLSQLSGSQLRRCSNAKMSSGLLIYVFAFFAVSANRAHENTTAKNDFETSLHRFQEGVAMGLNEMFATACGVHVLGDSVGDEDTERRLIAIASTNLWIRLPLMEAVQYVFEASVLSAIANNVEKLSRPSVHNIVREIFENVELLMLDDVRLATLYSREKWNAEFSLSPEKCTRASTFAELWTKNACYREFAVRMHLLLHSFESRIPVFSFLSRAVLHLAKTSEGDRVQQLFDEAVNTTAKNVIHYLDDLTVSGIDTILFSILAQLIEETPDVKKNFIDYTILVYLRR